MGETKVGKMIELSAGDGHKLGAYRADPKGKPRGGLIVVQEIFGVNSHIKSVADGYAADGYLAIAPAFFDRVERGLDIGYTQPDIERGRAFIPKMQWDTVIQDAGAALANVKPAGKTGIVGYCWGGTVSWMSASRLAGLSAAVTYYGVLRDPKPDFSKLKGPVLGHFGSADEFVPVEAVKQLEAEMRAAGADVTFHLCEGATHAFFNDLDRPERVGVHDAEAAELSWQRTVSFLRSALASG